MSHVPEQPTQFVCESCQVVHAGMPIPESPGRHTFEPPDECGHCGNNNFYTFGEWVRYNG